LKQTAIWFGKAVWGAAYSFYRMFTPSIWKQLLGISEPTVERPVSVVGASRLAGDFFDQGAFIFLNFLAFILLFLAFVNLLPLPPLDGGYLMVLLVEKVSGKEVDLRKLTPIAVVVLGFFVVLFLLTLRLDIFNPINLP
jgi:membrane-associated protease RseP (regulator of RpoE activity)